MRRIALLFALAACGGVLLLFYKINALEKRPAPARDAAATVNEAAQHAEAEHIEVAVFMGRIQRYHQKWWLAGKAGNVELSQFYLHEMEEAMEEIADAHVVDDDVKLTPLMESFGIATIERLEKKLKEEGVAAMHADGAQLVASCNACHASSGHGFIRIRVPVDASFPDQDFAPAN